MESVTGEVDGGELRVGDLDALRVFVSIQLGPHREAGISRRRRDQLDDGAVGAQGFTPPVNADELEETMLDLIPFAGSRGEMANGYGEFELVGQLLNLNHPQTDTVPVAAATISRDH
jgi:hypothetical protein